MKTLEEVQARLRREQKVLQPTDYDQGIQDTLEWVLQ